MSQTPEPQPGTAWSVAAIPSMRGRTALVTGANSGLGLETTLALARAGATVLLACRDPLRGDEALGQVRVQVPGAVVELVRLDLADLASVRAAATRLTGSYDRLDLLVNNAGVMGTPKLSTADGFELQFGTNHLGHFALTGLLMPLLLAGERSWKSRVVTVSSGAHKMGRIDRADLMGELRYRRWRAYGQAKLANLLFMNELATRAGAVDAPLISVAAHPGYAATNLQSVGPRLAGRPAVERLFGLANRVLAQSAEYGAWPILRAATDPDVRPGDYFGPDGFGEMRGRPKRVPMSAAARDPQTAGWLWQRSIELTGVDFPALTPGPAPGPAHH